MPAHHSVLISAIVALAALTRPVAAQQQPAAPQPFHNAGVSGLGNAAPTGTQAPPPVHDTPVTRPHRDNPTTSIQEFVKLEGHSRTPLRGIGIVVGLKGTGDSGNELVLARPLAEVYRNNGNPLPDLKDLAKAKSAAIVMISCDVPEGGALPGDEFDVIVAAPHSATSLKGGQLIISPLLGPLPRQGVFGFASGAILLEDPETPTRGRIRHGGQIVNEISPKPVGDTFDLVVKPYFRSFATTRTIASEINGITADLENAADAEQVATAINEERVRVVVPVQERSNPANFIANIMTKRFSPSLIDLPAMVIVNEHTGSIVITGDVEISAVTVGNDKLVVTTTTPPPQPTQQDPLVTRENWTAFGTTSTSSQRARILDLLEAFKALNVPTKDQIQILAQIDRTGRLHAKFISDE